MLQRRLYGIFIVYFLINKTINAKIHGSSLNLTLGSFLEFQVVFTVSSFVKKRILDLIRVTVFCIVLTSYNIQLTVIQITCVWKLYSLCPYINFISVRPLKLISVRPLTRFPLKTLCWGESVSSGRSVQ